MSDMLQSRVYPTFFTSPLASSGHWYEPYDSYHRCPPYEIENTFSVGRVPPPLAGSALGMTNPAKLHTNMS